MKNKDLTINEKFDGAVCKTSEDVLNAIHQLVAQSLVKTLQSGEATAQDINAALKFLKDNNVAADVTQNKSVQDVINAVNTKTEELPFETGDEDE